MCVCVCVCVYVYIYICMYVCLRRGMDASEIAQVLMCVCMLTYICVCVYVCSCGYMYGIHTYTHAYIQTYIYTHAQTGPGPIDEDGSGIAGEIRT